MIKKVLITAFLIFSLSHSTYSQYFYVPNLTAGENPSGLNKDIEQITATGWTTIATTNSNPAWSTIVNLPTNFSFLFNGTSVSSYKVATSGVLTFTTSASLIPASNNTAIPSTSIPNNSILVWGLEASGANDVIRYKTFGIAPNRQHWIQFASYSAPGSSGTNWTYWGIVLEETTNKIYIVDQRTYLTPLTLTLGVQINSSTAYQITGAPNTPSVVNNGSIKDTYDDNAYYEFIQGIRPVKDASLIGINISKSGLISSTDTLKYTLKNIGSDTIKNVLIKYKVNNSIYTDTVKNISIPTNSIKQLNHKRIFIYPNIKTIYEVSVWTELLNDNNYLNDTLKTKLSSLTFLPTKRVLAESSRELWNQWSPRSEARLHQLKLNNLSQVSAVAIYENSFYYNDLFLSGGFPEGHIDRSLTALDPNDFNSVFENNKKSKTPIEINIYSTPQLSNPSLLNLKIKVKSATQTFGRYKIGLLFTEDSILLGPQSNAYSNGVQGVMGGFETLPNPVVLGTREYNNYLKGILGTWNNGFWSLPNQLVTDSIYEYNYNSFLPGDFLISNPNKMHIVAFVLDSTTGLVINCNEINFNKLSNRIENSKEICKNEISVNINGNKVSSTYQPTYKWIYSLTDSTSNFISAPGVNNQSNYTCNSILISNPKLWIRRIVLYGTSSDTSNVFELKFNQLPNIKLRVNSLNQCLNQNSFNFVDSSTVLNGTIASRLWDFGDGTTSTLKTPVKTFNKSGSYIVKLFVTTNKLCSDTTSIIVNVYSSQKTIIKVMDSIQCINTNIFSFYDSTQLLGGVIATRAWDFGDGTTSTSTNPIKKYNSIGNYNVKLKTFTNNGCVDSTKTQVIVIKSPQTGNIAGPNTNIQTNTQYLYNINQQLNHTYEWQIENGAIISGQGTNAINIQWLNNGAGVLRCIITSINSCTDTAKLQLNVGPTGINDIKNSNIKIYPNPTNNIINVEGLSKNENNSIQIFDVQGKLVITKTITEKGTIDLSELNKGVYVIKIGEVAQRIVKM